MTVSGFGESRQQALTDAQRAAVESGLGVALESETYIRDYIVQSDRVRTVSSGVVTSLAIKAEKQDSAGMWSVTIDATVDGDKLKGNIALMLSQIDNPKSMVVVDPYSTSNSEFSRSVHRQLNASLLTQGFEVVNENVSQQLRAEMGGLMDVNKAGQSAAALALKYNADVVWMVVVKQRQGNTSYGVTDHIADVGCQVIASASGQIFADAEVSVKGVDQADAARRAGKELTLELVNQVKIQFAALAQQGVKYSIRLWRIDSYRQARGFRKALAALDGFSDVKQNALAIDKGADQNFVDLTLTFRGTTDELLDSIFDKVAEGNLESLDVRLQRSTQIELEL